MTNIIKTGKNMYGKEVFYKVENDEIFLFHVGRDGGEKNLRKVDKTTFTDPFKEVEIKSTLLEWKEDTFSYEPSRYKTEWILSGLVSYRISIGESQIPVEICRREEKRISYRDVKGERKAEALKRAEAYLEDLKRSDEREKADRAEKRALAEEALSTYFRKYKITQSEVIKNAPAFKDFPNINSYYVPSKKIDGMKREFEENVFPILREDYLKEKERKKALFLNK